MASSFSSYFVARSGIQNAQYNLRITGQNMANVNTNGTSTVYTRQRLDSYAVGSSGNNMRYANTSDLAIGGGVDAKGVSQLRDPYLDVRYRLESGKVSKSGAEVNTLSSVEDLFDEIRKNGINSQITDLIKQLNTLAGSPADTNLETIVKNSALLLTQAFHNAAEQLSSVRKQETDSFMTTGIDQANSLLKNIAQLNREIKSCDISQVPALELRDQRNMLLDQLSQEFNIRISSSSVSIGAGRTVEELQVNLVNGNNTIPLIDNDQYVQFEAAQNQDQIAYTADGADGKPHVYKTKELNVSVYMRGLDGQMVKNTDGSDHVFNDDLTTGVFGGYLSMLNDNGEFDAHAGGTVTALDGETVTADALPTTARGIGYYEKVMDRLAQDLAKTLNDVNAVSTTVTDPDDPTKTKTVTVEKPLFSSSDGAGTPITAANISISDEWNTATGNYITATKEETLDGVDNSKSGKNILYMVLQFSKEKTFTTDASNTTANGGVSLFTTSLSSYVSKVSTTLGLDIKTATNANETYSANLNNIDTQRASISSVDLNEEGINLVMFNQALTASSRFMTTMDEAMDTIINKMGVVGR
ncbi:flagellar hook-associated protein FlgK [Faecalispora jeddahensis]|uniref:flagellar hook-associated protein FlgK n=1 Tax=Faecalispora jeddahensis TaxID=1414721 RepID=UPI00189BFC2B|nr:flagellar hook-associated protein FlgK [Faecalispora jeddahensis]MBS5781909.1 flagellar hook-associated protein FlgK [Clostridium sp.]